MPKSLETAKKPIHCQRSQADPATVTHVKTLKWTAQLTCTALLKNKLGSSAASLTDSELLGNASTALLQRFFTEF